MCHPRTGPTALDLDKPFVSEFVYSIGHILTCHAIIDKLRMGYHQLAIFKRRM